MQRREQREGPTRVVAKLKEILAGAKLDIPVTMERVRPGLFKITLKPTSEEQAKALLAAKASPVQPVWQAINDWTRESQAGWKYNDKKGNAISNVLGGREIQEALSFGYNFFYNKQII